MPACRRCSLCSCRRSEQWHCKDYCTHTPTPQNTHTHTPTHTHGHAQTHASGRSPTPSAHHDTAPRTSEQAMSDPEDKVYRRGAPDTFDPDLYRKKMTAIRSGQSLVCGGMGAWQGDCVSPVHAWDCVVWGRVCCWGRGCCCLSATAPFSPSRARSPRLWWVALRCNQREWSKVWRVSIILCAATCCYTLQGWLLQLHA